MRWILALIGLLGLAIGVDDWILEDPMRLALRVTSPVESTLQIKCSDSHFKESSWSSLKGLASGTATAEFALPAKVHRIKILFLNGPDKVHVEEIAIQTTLSSQRLIPSEDIQGIADTVLLFTQEGQVVAHSKIAPPSIAINMRYFQEDSMRKRDRARLAEVQLPLSIIFAAIGIVSVGRHKHRNRKQRTIAARPKSSNGIESSQENHSQWQSKAMTVSIAAILTAHFLFTLNLVGAINESLLMVPPFLLILLIFLLHRQIKELQRSRDDRLDSIRKNSAKIRRKELSKPLRLAIISLLILFFLIVLGVWILAIAFSKWSFGP